MLFVLGTSVSELFASDSDVRADREGLDYLALGAAEGNHRIIGGRRELVTLSNNPRISQKTGEVLKRAAGRVSQEGRLQYKLSGYGIIEATTATAPSSALSGAQRIVTFPLQWFDSTAKIQPTTILGEDSFDSNIYCLFGEVGSVLGGLPHLPIAFFPGHGGGGAIGRVLGGLMSANKLCVCIVDSDAACPSGVIGGTARVVQSYKNNVVYPLVSVDETRSRDLENILPDTFYQSAFSGNASYRALANAMKRFTDSGETELRNFLDVEKGITLGQIYSHPVGSPERNFWDSKMAILATHFTVDSVALPCLAIGSCSQVGRQCTCIIVPGNGTNILDRFYREYGSFSRFELSGWLDDSVRPEWRRIGLNIASWCCGDDVLRT